MCEAFCIFMIIYTFKIQKMKTINYVLLLIVMIGFTTCRPKTTDVEPQSNSFPPKIWDKTFGGDQDDVASSIIATPDGGFIAVGSSWSSKSNDKSESGNAQDYWIVKIDNNGKKIWDKTIGGSDKDVPKSIVATPDGGFIIAGNSASDISGDKTEKYNGEKGFGLPILPLDYWLVKINSSGQKVWDRTFGSINKEELETIIATPDGGYISIGTSYTPKPLLNVPNYTDAGDYYGDCYMVKIDNNGKKVWEKLLSGKYRVGVKAAIITSDGSIMICGDSFLVPVKTDINIFKTNHRILKVNMMGELQWEKLVSCEGWLTTNVSLVATQNGNFVIGSNFDKASSQNFAKYGYWISEIDNSGNQLWEKKYSGNDDDRIKSIVKSNNGEFLIVGNSNSGKSGDKTDDNKGEYDYWILKTDNKGNKIWDKSVGGKQNEDVKSIIATDDGCIILGTSISEISGDKSEKSRGGKDYWLIKLGFK